MAKGDRARIDSFLMGRRVAFVGLSTNPQDFSRSVDRELVARGYEVIPVHPGVERIDERPAFARVCDVPGGVDWALVMTPPARTLDVVRDCVAAGVRRVWLHRGMGHGAVSDEAIAFAEQHGIELVRGECPLMFLPDATAAHRFHAWCKKVCGTYPAQARSAQ